MTDNIADNVFSILFVDDEKNILSSLKRLFRNEGYDIHIADGGKQGLEILESYEITVVVSDMRMPEMNGAQFLEIVANKWPSTVRILLTGYSEMESTIEAINKGNIYKYISKPWEDNDLKLTVKNAIESKQIELERDRLLVLTSSQNEELKRFNTELEAMVDARTSELNQTMGMLESAYKSLKESYESTIKVFSNIIEIREGSLRGHSKDIADLSKKLALKYGLSADDAQQVYFSGLLKDLGKIGLPDNMINRSVATMPADIESEYVKHPLVGFGILMSIEPLKESAKYIRGYREQYDGNGYPDRLSNNDIPAGSRILSITNDFYALQNGLITESRMNVKEALVFIKKNSGSLYDPELVNLFVGMIDIDYDDLNNTQENAVTIPVADLESNMILARDLLTKDGILLLSEGHKLGDHMIRQLQKFEKSLNEVLTIYIRQ